MSLKIRCVEKTGYLLVLIEGRLTPESIRESLQGVQRKARETGVLRILMDARNMQMPEEAFTRFQTGEQIAHFLGQPYRVAGLVRAGDITGFAENAAVNRGADFRIFTDEIPALDWLFD